METAKIMRDGHGKLDEKSNGVGEISKADIRARAQELAIIDGRKGTEFTEADYLQARTELSGATNDQPEPINGVRLPEEAAATQGHRTRRSEFEDEETIGVHLVKEGIEEAQHDEMLAAGEEALREEI